MEVLRLDRPERRNAMDTALLRALLDALDELAADEGLRALVFSTTSERALSAGADVAEDLEPEAGVARMKLFTRLYAAVDAFPLPTVAVCVGNVVGAGAELAAGCDLRVGGDNLKLAWPGAKLGVPVGPARLVPLGRPSGGHGRGRPGRCAAAPWSAGRARSSSAARGRRA